MTDTQPDHPLLAPVGEVVAAAIAELSNDDLSLAVTRFRLGHETVRWAVSARQIGHRCSHSLDVRTEPPWSGSANLYVRVGYPYDQRIVSPETDLAAVRAWLIETLPKRVQQMFMVCRPT